MPTDLLKFTYTFKGYSVTFYIHPSQLQMKVIHSQDKNQEDSYFIMFEGRLQQIDRPSICEI